MTGLITLYTCNKTKMKKKMNFVYRILIKVLYNILSKIVRSLII